MSLSRKKLRELLMKLTFQYDFFENRELKQQVEVFLEQEEELTEEDITLVREKMQDIYSRIPELDQKIAARAKGWSIERMSKPDLAILRLAVYEMLFDDDIPVSVSINEAVELAKLYGPDDSYKFVNGVLGSVAKTLTES